MGFQLNEDVGTCLTCFGDMDVSEMETHNHSTLRGRDKTDQIEDLPIRISSLGCFCRHRNKLICDMCDFEINPRPSKLYKHVLGQRHNIKLWQYLSENLSNKEAYLEAKQFFIATSTDKAYCLLCDQEMYVSEIKFHLAESPHSGGEQQLNIILDELPVKYKNITYFCQSGVHVLCKPCENKMLLTPVHLHKHVLTQCHLKHVALDKLNTLQYKVKKVKCLAQFWPNEVWCLICREKLHSTEIIAHEHLLGHVSKPEESFAITDCFTNILKHVRCLVQTIDNKVFCSICNCDVLFSIGNLLEHVLGENHNKNICNQFEKSVPKVELLKHLIQCDANELLCLDCNIKLPINLDAVLDHTKPTHYPTSDTLQKLKNIACLVCLKDKKNSRICSICVCLVPWFVKNVLEHLLGKPHNKKIANHPEKLNCFVQVDKDEVVCFNCNSSMSASSTVLNKHITDCHHIEGTPDFSNVISQQFKSNKCLIKTVDDKITCLVCQCTIPAEMKIIQTHLSEIKHLNNLSSTTAHLNFIGKQSSNIPNLSRSEKSIDCFLDVLTHIRCLILTNDNKAVCSICSCDVPLTIPNLLRHVLGENHNKHIPAGVGKSPVIKFQLQNCIVCDKNCILCLDCNAKFPLNSDSILNHSKKTHPTASDILHKFKDISCLAQLEQNSLFGSVCNCLVPWSVRNILEHLLGRTHNNKIMNGIRTSKTSDHFVQISQEEVLCLICNCAMLGSSTSLETHLSQYHNNGSSNFSRVISQQFQNHKFLVRTVDNQVTCLLCQCTFPADMKSVQSHLSETSHTDNLSFDTSTFLTGEFANVKCFLKTDVAQVMCLICNCFVPLSSVNLNEHLLGRRHNNKKREVWNTNMGFVYSTLPI